MSYPIPSNTTILLLSSLLVLLSFLVSECRPGTSSLITVGKIHGYLDQDVPQLWPIGELQPVMMSVENSQRYALDTPLGDSDWAALMPPNDGLIHLDTNHRPFTVSLFHQLQCLDIIRAAVIARASDSNHEGPGDLERHCMNYLREMVLCRSDLRLENVRNTRLHSVQPASMHTCRDWERVYQEAGNDQKGSHSGK